MLDREFVSMMAHYNRWQNKSLYAAAEEIGEAERQADRGAFFGSIQGTLSHLMWGDSMWMSRFDGWETPATGIPASAQWGGDWSGMAVRRREMDAAILDWAGRVTAEALAADLTWFSGASQREVTKPTWFCVAHFFNHQTHHRGQVHAMLTAAGATPDDTDLFLMPTG